MTYVNPIPELDGNNYGKWYQKLEIALAMANIDLVVTTPAPQEPEKPVINIEAYTSCFSEFLVHYDIVISDQSYYCNIIILSRILYALFLFLPNGD